MTLKPTAQQEAILDAIKSKDGNLAIVARAGCGKTSTIMMAVDAIARAYPSAETTICAFNKAIADEVKGKLNEKKYSFKQVNASTLHGLGYGLLRYAFKNPKVTEKKVYNLIRQSNDMGIDEALRGSVEKLVRMAKAEGFGFFDDRHIGDVGAWYRMADHYDINGFDDTTMLDQCISHAQSVYRRSLRMTDVIDFDDMILMPLVHNLRVRFTKDFLMVDEAQDLSRARQALARKFVKRKGGRMVIVGDDRQAIYGFSGADADALTNLTESLRCEKFPLSITWRCPKAVVREANRFVADIEAAPTAPEGIVDHLAMAEIDFKDAIGRVAILCRNTAPLIDKAFSLLREGIPAKVEGRDIGENLKLLLNRWKSARTISAYLEKIEEYKEREMQKAIAKNSDKKAEAIEDKCETIKALCMGVSERGGTHVSDVVDYIDELFADGPSSCVVLATYHRSKGREWPWVALLSHDQYCPSQYASKQWQLDQEDNLAYVAITRAQERLTFAGA